MSQKSYDAMAALGGRRLLVLDDDPTMLAVYQVGLQSPAWTVEISPDALQALILIKQYSPFLVIFDVRLAGYTSADLLRALRAEPEFNKLPVIVLTGMPLREVERMMPRVDRHLRLVSKPPEFPKLFDLIREMTGVDGRPARAG